MQQIVKRGIGWGLLCLLLAGCYQNSGMNVEPTIALATATAPLVVPTLALPTQTAAPGAAPSSLQPTTTPQAGPTQNPLDPTFTPFVTKIGPEGFQTSAPANSTLFPPTQGSAQPVPTIDALSTPTGLPTDQPCTYTVQSGDTFYAIARKLSAKAEDLIAANPRTNINSLQIGDVLQLPNCKQPTNVAAASVSAPTSAPGAPTNPPGQQTYTVMQGDYLLTIATRFGVTVGELVKANNFPNDKVILNIGQVLIIPPKSQ